MSTFSLKGGLYERAQKKYNLSEGKKLFTYPFFERQKLDAQVLVSPSKELWLPQNRSCVTLPAV